jgi:hypothetical protein
MQTHDRAADEQSGRTAEGDVQKERREFLEKCGRFAAYTTPAVLLLLHGTRAQASVSP